MSLQFEKTLVSKSPDAFEAITAVDGRYRKQVEELVDYFSEAALNRARVQVEVKYLIQLSKKQVISGLPNLNDKQISELEEIYSKFDSSSVKKIKEIEVKTQHDVKAIEYYIDSKIEESDLFSNEEKGKLIKAVHFCCTSEDINNLSYALCLKAGVNNVWVPKLTELLKELVQLAKNSNETPLLAKTHGQPATPTTVGKEIAVFIKRLERQLQLLKKQEYLGKFNGATGTFGAHSVAVPDFNWEQFSKEFVEQTLELDYNPLTTQIESHDYQAEIYLRLALTGRILTNLATDFWLYIMNEVFVQIPVEGATGSSTMPHKVNPIKFENAEANFEISDAVFSKLAETLPISRLQRDLTDSSTQRNIGLAFAHSLLAIDNLIAGIKRLKVNEKHLLEELEKNAIILAEPIQSVMRAEGIAGTKGMENPYERLKELTRGKSEISLEELREFIKTLNLSKSAENKLLELTPATYIGFAKEIAKNALNSLSFDVNNKKRINSLNDLILAILFLLGIVLTVTITIFVPRTVFGLSNDFHSLTTQIALYIQFPVYVIYTLGLYLFPALIAFGILKRKDYHLFIAGLFGVILSYLTILIFSHFVLNVFINANLNSLFFSSNTSFNLHLPVIIAALSSALFVVGPQSKDKYITSSWIGLTIYSILLIIFSFSTIVGILFCYEVGAFIGLIIRFVNGRETTKISSEGILKSLNDSGLEITKLNQIKTESINKRIYIANSKTSSYRVVVFDAESQGLGLIAKVIQFLRLKETRFGALTFRKFLEHICLTNYAVAGTSANYPKLLIIKEIVESGVLVFDNSLEVEGLTNSNKMCVSPADYYKELRLTHLSGYTWRSITPNQLKLRGKRAAIWECERGELLSSPISRRLDEAQLLVSLSLVFGKQEAVKAYLSFVNSKQKNSRDLINEIASVLTLCEKVTMPYALRRLEGIKQFLTEIRILLQTELDSKQASELDLEKVNIRRFNKKTVVSITLTVFGIMLALGQLNYKAVVNSFTNSNHFWAFGALIISLFSFVGGAILLTVFPRLKVKFSEAVQVQIAASKEMIKLPAGAGAFLLNNEYLKKNHSKRVSKSVSFASATCIQIFQILGTTLLVFFLSLFSGKEFETKRENINNIIFIIFLVLLIVFLIPKTRKFVLELAKGYFFSVSGELAFIFSQPKRWIAGLFGVVLQAMAYAISFWFCLEAFGVDLDITTASFLFLVGNSAGGLTPTPGGIGIVELSLTTLLVAVGVNPSISVSAVLLFRIITFWLRIPLGILFESRLKRLGKL